MRIDPTPNRLRWLGTAGSALLAFGAAGAGVLPRPDPLTDAAVLSALRHGTGRVLCIAVAAAGMALLVTAWLLVGRGLDRVDRRGLYVTAALWSVPLLLAPPILSRDVYAYAVAGRMLDTGLNPYDHGAADLASPWVSSTSTSWLHVPFAYGPLFLLLARLVVAAAGNSLVVAVLGLRALAVAATVLLGWALPRAARACGVDERSALWLGLLNPLLIAHFVGGAHADALMVALLVTGVSAAAGRWPLWGAVLCALAGAVKGTALVALPFVAVLWCIRSPQHARPLVRAVAATAGAAGVTFVAVTAVSGVGYGWIGTVSTVGLTRQWTSLPTGLGLAVHDAARLLGVDVSASAALGVTRTVGLLVTVALLAWLWLRAVAGTDARHVVRQCGWALLAVVALGPAVHPWYVTWPVAVLAAAGVAGRPRTALVATSAALCFLVLPDGYNLARATEPVGVGLDVVVAVGLVVLGVRSLIRRRMAETVTV